MDKIIEILKYIFLGVVQGVSEIMPISSSAHLLFFSNLLGISTSTLTLELFLHLGSAIAVIFFFRKRIWRLIKGAWGHIRKKKYGQEKEFETLICLIIATLPAVAIAFVFQKTIENIFTRLLYVGISLLFTSFIIMTIYYKKKKGEKSIGYIDSLIIGFFQAVGIIPGISRSGITLAGASKRNIEPSEAADFIFLLLIPISLGGGILALFDLIQGAETGIISLIPSIVSFLVTIIFTLISLNVFLAIIKKGKLKYFSYYTLVAGLIMIFYSLFN